MTPCTETEMGAVADILQGEFRQGKERVNQVEVVIPDKTEDIIEPVVMRDKWKSVTQSVKVKEKEKRVVTAKQITESLQAIRATGQMMRQFMCHCKSCKVRLKSSNNMSGWSTERTVAIIRDKVEQLTWPKSVQHLKMLVAITEPTGKKEIEARGHLAYAELGKCQVRLKDRPLSEEEEVVVEDARHLVYGYSPEWSKCKFDEQIKIQLVTKKQDLVRVQGKRDRAKQVFDCTDASRMPWLMQDTDWNLYNDKETSTWVRINEELTEAMEQMYGVILVRSRQSDEDRHHKEDHTGRIALSSNRQHYPRSQEKHCIFRRGV